VRLAIVLVDAELELAPGSADDGRMPVLDAFYHRDLMNLLPNRSRRGRGDIVHSTLLLCQGSDLNREGRLEVFVHTRNDRVITIGRETDVHPNYVRFLQDMGSLLRGGSGPGYEMTSKDLRTLVREIDADLRVALSPSGEDAPIREVFQRAGDGTVLAMIGAFPEGDFTSPVYDISEMSVSLGPMLMRVPEVTETVLKAVIQEK
jgi:rRNA small subunit pseudouridine methyltransferase Nep1